VPWVRGLQGGSLPAVLQVVGIACLVAAIIAAIRRGTGGRSFTAGSA
jgi:hypothetical protein